VLRVLGAVGRGAVRAVLALYPREFRRQLGTDIRSSIEDGWTEASAAGVARALSFLLVCIADLVTACVKERVRSSLGSDSPSPISTSEKSRVMLGLWQDVSFAVRSLVRRPGFSTVAILTLALGLGTTTAVFSVVNGVLLRPLPYPEASRLIRVWSENREQGWTRSTMSRPDIADIRLLHDVDFVEGFVPNTFTLPTDGRSLLVEGSYVSGGLLQGFGLAPVLGRDIRHEENRPSASPVAVVSHSLWQRWFGGDSDIVGTMVQIDEESYQIIGVAPTGFDFPNGSELWVPYRHPCHWHRGCRNLSAVGRLASGTQLPTAQAALTVLGNSLREQHPEMNSQVSFRFEPLLDVLVGEVRPGLWVLLGAVLLMLLVVCANMANLIWARVSARRGEVALRAALGATRARLVGQFLVESLVIAGLGCGAGLVVAFGLVRGFKASTMDSFPRVAEVGVDASVLLFALALAGVVAVLFGSGPAQHLSRQSIVGSLRQGGRGDIGRREGTTRSWLVAAEVGLSVVLMIGAGLLTRSLGQLYRVDQGFEHREVLRFNLSLPPGGYGDTEALVSLFQEVEASIEALPGVAAVGSVVGPPLGREAAAGNVDVEGRPAPSPSEKTYASVHAATPGYFTTLGLRVVQGRGLEIDDRAGTIPVAVVSERFARESLSDGKILGERFRVAVATGAGTVWTVVGVVRDTRSSLTGDPQAQVYVPLVQARSDQAGQQRDLTRDLGTMTVHVRPVISGSSLLPEIQQRLDDLDPRILTAGVETVARAIRRAAGPTRNQLQLVGLFAALAVTVAAVGLYGVVSYLVSQRTREIGIRVALGARGGEILRMVMGQGIVPAAAGIAGGLVVSLAIGRLLESLLFEVEPADAAVFGTVALLTLALSVGAILIPARQATKLDPTVSLKME